MGKQETVEMEPERILGTLLKHIQEQRPITLYNTYNGVPVTYEAEVAMVNPSYIGLIVHPYQAVCIKKERRTFLESKLLPELVRGHPVSIDYTNNVVLLKRLKFPRTTSVDLFNSWVSPSEPFSVTVDFDDGEKIAATLLKIAVLGENEIRVVMAVPANTACVRGDQADLTFKLPDSGELVQVRAGVFSLSKLRNKPKKQLEMIGKAAMQDEISILAYIARREDQLMGELDREYKKLRKGKKHKK